MFPVICYVEKDGSENWQNDDGWAGYQREFHTMPMSWTAWLMLRWGKELCPERQKEILDFCRPYADFLQKAQNPNGCIPSWFSPDGIPSRAQFRDFNAETASSALFLLEYGDMVQDAAALACGRRALSFVTDQVLPRTAGMTLRPSFPAQKNHLAFMILLPPNTRSATFRRSTPRPLTWCITGSLKGRRIWSRRRRFWIICF